MLISPEGWGGNFFNTWARASNQLEILPIYKLPQKNWWGHHELKAGVDFSHRSYQGTSYSHPIQILRQDETLAEQIDFQGPDRLHAQDTEVSEFLQDHWVINEDVALDLGGRLSSQSIGRAIAFSPAPAWCTRRAITKLLFVVEPGYSTTASPCWPQILWITQRGW